VAELAARGLTNRLIAQELWVTTATVETHLRHAFQKLDVTARGELGAALDPGRSLAARGRARR
jgi:DNA-binding NarL/FixJ family response regulator